MGKTLKLDSEGRRKRLFKVCARWMEREESDTD
jgi:hypothetical protein